tara:strand:+ start:432 stop:674 length:243 start_codon:yes stop_codon:yes gene_type:complete
MLKNMIGGGIEKKFKEYTGDSDLSAITLALLVLLIKALIVQFAYNRIWQKTWCCGNQDKFKPITFYEALLLVILFDVLFS